MKRVFALLTSLMMLFVSSMSVYAEDNNLSNEYSVKNEYLEMKKMQKEPSSKLKKIGFSSQEIEEIKDLDVDKEYSSHIYSLQNYSEQELKNLDYSDEQIEKIRNFDGEVEALTLLGAKCKTYISRKSFSKSGDTTNAVLNFSFKWSGVPYFKFKDAVVFAWNNGLYVNKGKSYMNITYKGRYNSTMKQKATQDIVGTQDAGVIYTFPVKIGVMNVSQGSGVVYLSKKANVKELGTRVEYGHREIGGTPSASITVSGTGLSGSVGISFDKKTKTISYNTAKFTR